MLKQPKIVLTGLGVAGVDCLYRLVPAGLAASRYGIEVVPLLNQSLVAGGEAANVSFHNTLAAVHSPLSFSIRKGVSNDMARAPLCVEKTP